MRRICLSFVALAAVGLFLPALQAVSSAAAGTIALGYDSHGGDGWGWWNTSQHDGSWNLKFAVTVEEDSSDVLERGSFAGIFVTLLDRAAHAWASFADPLSLTHSLSSLVSQHVRLQI
jgi:hypothetical protein